MVNEGFGGLKKETMLRYRPALNQFSERNAISPMYRKFGPASAESSRRKPIRK